MVFTPSKWTTWTRYISFWWETQNKLKISTSKKFMIWKEVWLKESSRVKKKISRIQHAWRIRTFWHSNLRKFSSSSKRKTLRWSLIEWNMIWVYSNLSISWTTLFSLWLHTTQNSLKQTMIYLQLERKENGFWRNLNFILKVVESKEEKLLKQ